jgi:hypothetical protein
LKFTRTLLVVTPLVLMGWRMRRGGVPWYGVAVAGLIAVLVLARVWNLRPYFLSTIGILLVSGMLHDHCNGRKPLSWGIVVAMLLWGNLHPEVIVGQGLILGAIGWEWANRYLKWNPPLDGAACWRLTLVGGLAVLASLLCPDPWVRFWYPFSPEIRHPIMRVFAEVRPLHVFFLEAPMFVLPVYFVAAVVAFTVARRFHHYRLWEVLLLLGLTGLAFTAFRAVQSWLLVLFALGGPHLTVLLRQWADERRKVAPGERWQGTAARWQGAALRVDRFFRHLFGSPLFRLEWAWPVGTLMVLGVLSVTPVVAWRMPIQDRSDWPTAALDWMQQEGLAGNFFAPPDYGAYLTWRLGPQARVYADTRGFFFPPELLEDCHFIPQFGPDWRERLRRVAEHGTDYYLLETTGPRGRLWQTIAPHVEKPLYVDGLVVLLRPEQLRDGLTAAERAGSLP